MSFDIEKAKRNIESVLEKAYTETDINSLREYRKLFKKEISFFRRSWASAYLLMYYDQRETPSEPEFAGELEFAGEKSHFVNYKNPVKNKTDAAEERNSIVEIPEEESKRIFISIGKNRRLFPRDVITLIMTKAGAAREDIGMIRILDNYSFVQVRDNKADQIIASLNGQRFRGRTLAVNYAKPKNHDDADSASS